MSGPEIERLIQLLAKLPGLGPRSARRAALHLIKRKEALLAPLAEALGQAAANIHPCGRCGNLDSQDPCAICADARRDESLLCVVEQPRDLISLEQTAQYRGLYHVLLGRIAPLEGIGPDQLSIDALVERVRTGNFKEVIMATNPTLEGDGTSLHITNLLADFPVEITRLARGITTGSVLEFANKEILADALDGRQKF